MPVEIEEIVGRSKQGVTAPYICRGSDKKLYFVKGKGAGYDSLFKEWVAGQLARRFGLPIPRFELVLVPKELYEIGRDGFLRDLGFGLMFGSERKENVNEISMINIKETPAELKRDIAAFDWWIQNGDRTLTESGGNPNILWSDTHRQLFIIDHNLAFDETVTLNSQLQSHIFSQSLSEICAEKALQDHYRAKFKAAISDLAQILRDIPDRWHYVDEGCTISISLSAERVEAILQRYQMPTFWERT
jgi:hypothetical protein